jgi:uncharacterized protein YukE
MAVTLRVDPQVLINVSSDMNTQKTTMVRVIDDAKAKIDSLAASYVGTSADALYSRFKQTYDDAEKVVATISEHISDLNAVGLAFQKAISDAKIEAEAAKTGGGISLPGSLHQVANFAHSAASAIASISSSAV